MRTLQSNYNTAPGPGPSPSAGYVFGVSYPTRFDIKSTVLYVGLSIGTLLAGLVLTCFIICCWYKPSQQRRAAAEEVQRQRDSRLQDVKVETDEFRPQLRSVPVIVVQPGSEDISFGLSDDLSEVRYGNKLERMSTISSFSCSQYCSPQGIRPSYSHASMSSLGFTPRESADSEALQGEGVLGGPSRQALSPLTEISNPQNESPTERLEDASGSLVATSPPKAADEVIVYNPLTHFLTDRRPRLFTADVVYTPQSSSDPAK